MKKSGSLLLKTTTLRVGADSILPSSALSCAIVFGSIRLIGGLSKVTSQ